MHPSRTCLLNLSQVEVTFQHLGTSGWCWWWSTLCARTLCWRSRPLTCRLLDGCCVMVEELLLLLKPICQPLLCRGSRCISLLSTVASLITTYFLYPHPSPPPRSPLPTTLSIFILHQDHKDVTLLFNPLSTPSPLLHSNFLCNKAIVLLLINIIHTNIFICRVSSVIGLIILTLVTGGLAQKQTKTKRDKYCM